MSEFDTELPPGWSTCRLGDFAEVRLGRQRSPSHASGDFMRPYLRAANVTWDGLDLTNVKSMNFSPREQEVHRLNPGDLLLAEASGSATEVGKPAVWSGELPECYLQNTLIRVRPPPGMNRFLLLQLWYAARSGRFIEDSKGVGIHHLGSERLSRFEAIVAPRAEQERIVSAVEQHLTRIGAAMTDLERVKAQLARYRASVLKAACEGRLVPTEADLARAEGREYETADGLLARILLNRRERFEQNQTAMKSKVRASGIRYKDPKLADAMSLPHLPEGWTWATVEALSIKVVDGVHKKPDYVSAGVPFVTVRNLTLGSDIDFEHLRLVTESAHLEFSRRANPERDDILISKDGTLGVVRRVKTDRRFSIFVSVALVKPVLREISPYLTIALSSPQVKAQMVPKGSGLQHIHLEDLREDCIPVAPLSEQRRIVAEVERRLSIADEIAATIDTALARAERLRQSILKRAFEGKLVPQDPNDEPASVLLDRIRKEREAAEEVKGLEKKPRRAGAARKRRAARS